MEFKDRIKARRIELGLTLDEVAKIVGVSNATISRWESGAIENQRRDKVELLAKALRVSPGELMGWSDVEPTYGPTASWVDIYTAASHLPEDKQEAVGIAVLALLHDLAEMDADGRHILLEVSRCLSLQHKEAAP